MSHRVAVLRPEPGNAATCARVVALGLDAVALPLFSVAPLAWSPPDPAEHDALLLTSANTLAMTGDALEHLTGLPVLAVGAATATAARAAGFDVVVTGTGDASALLPLAARRGTARALHLGGRETTVAVGGVVSRSIPVYASVPRLIEATSLAPLIDGMAMLHSARAAAQLGKLVDSAGIARGRVAIAAISHAVAAAAGAGWRAVTVAEVPTDAALIAAVGALAARLPD